VQHEERRGGEVEEGKRERGEEERERGDIGGR
jgi:hypothetical protein